MLATLTYLLALSHVQTIAFSNAPVQYVGFAEVYSGAGEWGCRDEAKAVTGTVKYDERILALALPSNRMCGKYVIVENVGKKQVLALQLGVVGKDCLYDHGICITSALATQLGIVKKAPVLVRWYDKMRSKLACFTRVYGFCIAFGANIERC